MKKVISELRTAEQTSELAALAALSDGNIDTSEIPEQRDWSGSQRGLFYRPIKQQITLRLDADVVAWFKSEQKSPEGYQTRINKALRAYMEGLGESAIKR